jgi:hypothetical protein
MLKVTQFEGVAGRGLLVKTPLPHAWNGGFRSLNVEEPLDFTLGPLCMPR